MRVRRGWHLYSMLIWGITAVCVVISYFAADTILALSPLFVMIMIGFFAVVIFAGKQNLLLILNSIPVVFRVLAIFSFFYTIASGLLNMPMLMQGSPQMKNGMYYLQQHGAFLFEISEQEYAHLRLVEARFFTGHMLVFSAVPMAFFANGTHKGKRAEKA